MHTRRGVILRNFLAVQKYQLSFNATQKISTMFMHKIPVNEHENPETIQIEACIASTERRFISLNMFYTQKHHGHNFSQFRSNNITFGNF